MLGIAAAPMNWPLGDGHGLPRRLRPRRQRACCSTSAQAQRAAHGAGRRRRPATIPTVARADRRQTRQQRPDRRAGHHRRRGHALRRRRRTAPARQTPVFFGSALQRLRRRAVPARAADARAARRRPRPSDDGLVEPDRRRLLGLRVQDPGEHGPAPPRPRRVRPRLLGPADQGHGWSSTRGSARRSALSRVYRFFGRDRETVPEALSRRRRRPRQPGPLRHRRHAVRRRGRVQFPPIPQFPAEHFAHAAARRTCGTSSSTRPSGSSRRKG